MSRDVIEDIRAETVDCLVTVQCPPGTYPEQWDVEGLKESVDEVLGLQPPVDEWIEEEAVEPGNAHRAPAAWPTRRWPPRPPRSSPSAGSEIEKNILLQTLDHHWKEHLSTLDALRQVIHLRSYAQKKPIDEYKQEAFLLFERLLVAIREDVTGR